MDIANIYASKKPGPARTIVDARRLCALLPGALMDRIDGLPGKRSKVVRELLELALDMQSAPDMLSAVESQEGGDTETLKLFV